MAVQPFINTVRTTHAWSELASITLDDDQPQRLHTCGDTVRGTVKLNQPLKLGDIVIHFKCKAKTLIRVSNGNSTTTYRGKAILYWYQTTLRRSAHAQVSNQEEYPFEFTFPFESQAAPQRMSWEPMRNYEWHHGHALPPSFTLMYQSVTHYLELIATTPDAFLRSKKKLSLPISFSPSRSIPDPEPDLLLMSTFFTRQTHLLDPERAKDGGYGFRAKMRVQFGKDDPNPVAAFTVRAEVPTVACCGHILSIKLHLHPDGKYSTVKEVPPVFLLNANVRLTAYTDYRVPRYGLISGLTYLERQNDHKISIYNGVVRGQPPIFENMDLGEIVGPDKLRVNVRIPTFRTYNLNRWYVIKVSINVKCADKVHELELGKHDINILPGPFRPAPGTVPSPSILTAVDPNALPRYTAAAPRSSNPTASDPATNGDPELPPYSRIDPATYENAAHPVSAASADGMRPDVQGGIGNLQRPSTESRDINMSPEIRVDRAFVRLNGAALLTTM